MGAGWRQAAANKNKQKTRRSNVPRSRQPTCHGRAVIDCIAQRTMGVIEDVAPVAAAAERARRRHPPVGVATARWQARGDDEAGLASCRRVSCRREGMRNVGSDCLRAVEHCPLPLPCAGGGDQRRRRVAMIVSSSQLLGLQIRQLAASHGELGEVRLPCSNHRLPARQPTEPFSGPIKGEGYQILAVQHREAAQGRPRTHPGSPGAPPRGHRPMSTASLRTGQRHGDQRNAADSWSPKYVLPPAGALRAAAPLYWWLRFTGLAVPACMVVELCYRGWCEPQRYTSV